ncbi:MAG: hypothetical protein DRQ88_08740 [Epsilonproteobacteria bacterium]|nr:MAG: hypothetical protein DRQ88_08740 [Campylobacterota bacterium]
MIEIKNIDDPRIEEFRSLKNKNLLRKDLIIVEGEKVILKLLNSSLKVFKIFAPKWFLEKYKSILQGDIYQADKKIREEIVGHHLHQGIMALAERPAEYDLCNLSFPALILNGVTSPENVGSIVRSCAAFGIKSLIIGPKSCSPYLRRCIRVSMGNIFSMKVHHSKNLEQTIDKLKEDSVLIYGTANIPGAHNLRTLKLKKESALIMGSEGHGIEPEILALCDQVIKIPVDIDVAHLNVATATAIFLYHLSS